MNVIIYIEKNDTISILKNHTDARLHFPSFAKLILGHYLKLNRYLISFGTLIDDIERNTCNDTIIYKYRPKE